MIHHKPKTAYLLLLLVVLLASSARCASASSACGSSKNSGSRRLSHPCGYSASQGSTTTTTASMYETNSNRGSNTYLNVALGTFAGLLSLFGLLFLVDREAFATVTGKCDCRRVRFCASSPKFPECFDSGGEGCCAYVGGNDDASVGATPREEFLTQDTAEYLAEKRDEESQRAMRIVRRILPCLGTRTVRTYDVDKYAAGMKGGDSLDIDDAGDEKNNVPVVVGGGNAGKMRTGIRLFAMGAIDALASFSEGTWARLCAPRPARTYPDMDADGRDKYYVAGESTSDDHGEVKYAASSYESADATVTNPW